MEEQNVIISIISSFPNPQPLPFRFTFLAMKLKNVPKRTKQQLKSAEIVASIDDLLIEILIRLPIKSLLQFKIVSKQWHSIITNPKFRHRRNPNPNPAVGVFLPRTTREINKLEYVSYFPDKSINPLKFTKLPLGIDILQSCNGLLLCCNTNNNTYHVYNPTTNQLSTLPKLDGVLRIIDGKRIAETILAFDPTKSPYHQVVSVCDLHSVSAFGHFQCQIVIYSSETGAWRISSEPFNAHFGYGRGVYWNDALHWIGSYQDGVSLYFNIRHHMLEKMPNPPMPSPRPNRTDFYFGESCDHLHYIQTRQKIQFNVYEMKRDYSEWFVRYNVDLSVVASTNREMIRSRSWMYYDFSMISIVRCKEKKEEDASFLVFQIPGKAIRYNIFSNTSEKLHEFEGPIEDTLKYASTSGHQYIESLCCV